MKGGESVADHLILPYIQSYDREQIVALGCKIVTTKASTPSNIPPSRIWYGASTGDYVVVRDSNYFYLCRLESDTYSAWLAPNIEATGGYSDSGNGTTSGIRWVMYSVGYTEQDFTFDAVENPILRAYEILSASPLYPITYHYTNSTVSGPAEAAVGDTVTVSAVPDVGYGITDASTQILVTNDDVAVPYTWDAVNQHITFTMPQPAENRGGFGSTGQ